MTRISSIYHRANGPAPVGKDAQDRNHQNRKELWHKHGVAVIDPNEIHNDLDQQHVISIATTLYGKRKGK